MHLLVGGDSKLGAATFRYLEGGGQAVRATTRRRQGISPEHPFFDMLRPLEQWQLPANVESACIFVAVARLRDCAADPQTAQLVNVERTLQLIDRLNADGIYVLFLSSNQVFSGDVPNVAADAPATPVSEYGRQKAATEAAIRARMEKGAPLAILRLSKILSPDLPLIQDWVRTLRAGQRVEAFEDMVVAPVPIALAGATIATLLERREPGFYQLTGPRDVSYADIARHLARELGKSPDLIKPVSAYSAGMPKGSTPAHTTLDCSLLREKFGIVAPDVWEALGPLLKFGESKLFAAI